MKAELTSKCVVLLYHVDNELTVLVAGRQLMSVVLSMKSDESQWAQRQQFGTGFSAESSAAEETTRVVHINTVFGC